MPSLKGFDANQQEPMRELEAIPAGDYVAQIVNSETKETKDGRGSYLEFTFEIIDGPSKGRQVWARLNLNNASDKAVAIAKSELSSICRAVGVYLPNDSCELHNIPLVIKVKLKKRDDNGEMTNEVKGYENKNGAAKPTTPATGNNGSPPWMRK